MKKKESYTLMILPNPTARAHRFSVSKKIVVVILTGCSVASLLLFLGFFHYAVLLWERVDLTGLRAENQRQKTELQTFGLEVSDLKKQLDRLKELETKLRVITDLGPAEEPSEGQGGPEEGLPEDEGLIQQMQKEVSQLQQRAAQQESSFEEMTQSVRERRSMWSATPSIWPVRGWFTSGFGMRVSPFTGSLVMHKGIDVATRRGTPLLAPASGIVTAVGTDSGLGKLLRINHGYGIETLYGHLDAVAVHVGDRIQRRQMIGYVGNSGLTTGPHLHYEVHVNRIPVNPLRYIID